MTTNSKNDKEPITTFWQFDFSEKAFGCCFRNDADAEGGAAEDDCIPFSLPPLLSSFVAECFNTLLFASAKTGAATGAANVAKVVRVDGSGGCDT